MGRPSNTTQRRQQIVEATVRVMARSGFDGASVQAIAKEAGLSAGLLHHHFSRKQDILYAVLEHLEAVLNGRFETRSQRRRGAWGRIEAWVDAHLAVGEDDSPQATAVWVWLGAHALQDEALRTRYDAVVRRRLRTLTGLIEELAAEQGRRIDARAHAVAALAMVEGYFNLASTTEVVAPGSTAGQVRRWLKLQLTPGDPR